MQQRSCTGGRIQAHPIGEATVAGGVIGEHQGQALPGGGGLAQAYPAATEFCHPSQPLQIGAIALDRTFEQGISSNQFLEAAHPAGDSPIQLRQGHLHAEIQRSEADAAGFPALATGRAAKQLQHWHPQGPPERRPGVCLVGPHRGKSCAAQHGLHLLTAKQLQHPLLHGLLPQATHQQKPRTKPLGPQGAEAGFN